MRRNRPVRQLGAFWGVPLLLGLIAPALCVADEGGEQPAPTPASEAAAVTPSEDERLLVGEFGISVEGVIDGDTIRVDGLKKNLRLLMLDTEEVLHGDDTDAVLGPLMESDFPAYVARVTGDAPLPIKYATPMGAKAHDWAREFFRDASRVRVERDTPSRATGRYGRVLCYIWALYDDGRSPQLYNLEAVRAGMSPYFNKYGNSSRFDEAFRAAQAEAQVAKRGIFSPDEKHYPDYERRIAWWDRRAAALDQLDRLNAGGAGIIALGESPGITKLMRRKGKHAIVCGLVDDHSSKAITYHDGGATVLVGGDYHVEVEVIGSELAKRMDLGALFGEAVFVHGYVDREGSLLPKRYQRGKGAGTKRYLRIVVTDAAQIRLAHLPFTVPEPPPRVPEGEDSGKDEAPGASGDTDADTGTDADTDSKDGAAGS